MQADAFFQFTGPFYTPRAVNFSPWLSLMTGGGGVGGDLNTNILVQGLIISQYSVGYIKYVYRDVYGVKKYFEV